LTKKTYFYFCNLKISQTRTTFTTNIHDCLLGDISIIKLYIRDIAFTQKLREAIQYKFSNTDKNEMTLWICCGEITYVYSELWKHKI
jgi:hypothetical protein